MKATQSREYYAALISRDKRFDGKFFAGVQSTGIYCRPVCPARKPRFENTQFFSTSAAAEEAGFRPCFKCRPESAPGSSAWIGTPAIVSRALRLISSGVLEDCNLPDFALQLGVTDRHLRRLFMTYLGTTPQSLDLTRRLDFARKLVDETTLTLSESAFASGFGSLRRFNDAFRKRFLLTPTEARKRRVTPLSQKLSEQTILLPYRPPFDWKSLLLFLKGRAIPGVEYVADNLYSRTFRSKSGEGWFEVSHLELKSSLKVHLRFSNANDLFEITRKIKELFDLEADPYEISRHLSVDPKLKSLLASFPGLRLPGTWDGFELSVRAVLGQQVSVKGASTLSGKIVNRLGQRFETGKPHLDYLFPLPKAFTHGDLRSLGLTETKQEAIRGLADKFQKQILKFDRFFDHEQHREELLKIRGIGPWTTEYIMMRAARDADAFPSEDLILKRLLGGNRQREYQWKPWRAYAAMYLWMSSKENEK